MKLEEAINKQSIEEYQKEFPGGISFKTKSILLGVSHEKIGGGEAITIPIEMLLSDKWGISFRPMSKEFREAIGGLFDSLGGNDPLSKIEMNKNKQIYETYFNHPCKKSCDGWHAGYRTAYKDMKNQLGFMMKICEEIERTRTTSRGYWLDYFRKEFTKLKSTLFINPTESSDE